MRRLALILFACVALVAQEGHPLSGTWSGDWGATPQSRAHVTIVMNWDGKEVTGLLNPGPDAAKVQSIALDPTTWTVRIEADAKDNKGTAVHISAEGKLEDLGSIHRSLKGTWQQGATKGDFRLTRD
jgi:hypothetical protein